MLRDELAEVVRSDGKPYCNAKWEYLPNYVVRCMEPLGHAGHHVSGLWHTYTWPQGGRERA